jgi:hypothetical protein
MFLKIARQSKTPQNGVSSPMRIKMPKTYSSMFLVYPLPESYVAICSYLLHISSFLFTMNITNIIKRMNIQKITLLLLHLNSMNLMHLANSKTSLLMTGLIPFKPFKLMTHEGLSLCQAVFLQLSASPSHAFSNVMDGDKCLEAGVQG